MTYLELKKWFTEWLDSRPDEPFPLEFSYGHTKDCRITIDVIITSVDNILASGKPNDLAKTYKWKLEQIKKAIEGLN